MIMHPTLMQQLARAHIENLRREAARHRATSGPNDRSERGRQTPDLSKCARRRRPLLRHITDRPGNSCAG